MLESPKEALLRAGIRVLLLMLGLAGPLAAQEDSHSRYSINAVQVPEGPVLDGVLDDAVWESGVLIDNFVQQEPDEGAPTSEHTEVRVLYDSETLYLGLRATDSAPMGVTATEMRRDSERILDEDNFQIILDTFMDSRSAYMFVTNPLGAQLDQQIANEGEGNRRNRQAGFGTSNINKDWDGVWHVAASQDADGWTAEIAIPMVTLRFPESEVQSWGLNLMRNIGRKNEQAFWAPIPKAYTLTRVSMAGSLTGLRTLNRGSDLRVTPFVTGGASRVTEAGQIDNSFQQDLGVDLKYGLTAGLNLDVTANTDFAQAEVDDEQVNLTRFPLFFPEKRDFFLENSGQFTVGGVNPGNRIVDLFFTRRIGLSDTGNVPILGGARLTGKVGRNDIAIMDVQTRGNELGLAGENFLVTRYSRNFLSRSRVGALFINKNQTEGISRHYNRTYAVDTSLSPHASLTITGLMAKTQTPGRTRGDMAGYVHAVWLDENYRIYSEYGDIQDDFNPEVGFLPRAGIRTSKTHFEFTPRPGRLGIREMSPMVNIIYTTDQQNRMVTRRMHYMMGTRFENGAYLNLWYNRWFERLDNTFSFRGVPLDPGDYSFGEFRASFMSNPARKVYYSLTYSPQTFYDGDRTDTSASVGVRFTDRFSTEASYGRNDVNLSNGSFQLDLASVKVDFALSPTMTLRAISQYNTSTDQFGTSARFRYEYKPGSDIYVVYDEVRRDPSGLPLFQERQLLLKFTHLLSR